MQRASDSFTAEQRESVARAVQQAESKTSAEIVPVVASVSGRYDRPEDLVGLWLGLLALAATWLVYPRSAGEIGHWDETPVLIELACLVGSVVIGFLVGATIASKVSWLRRLFTSKAQMQEEVDARARQVFFDHRVHRSNEATGLLIYISLHEHMAEVLGDDRIVEKLGQPALDELCGQFINGLQSANLTEALCRVIEAAGERLGSVLPRAADDVNELSDALVTID